MTSLDPEKKRVRARGVKRFLLFCLILSVISGIYSFQASFGIMPESAEWMRFSARLTLSIGAGLLASILFTIVYAVGDILMRTRSRLKDRVSLGDPDSSKP